MMKSGIKIIFRLQIMKTIRKKISSIFRFRSELTVFLVSSVGLKAYTLFIKNIILMNTKEIESDHDSDI